MEPSATVEAAVDLLTARRWPSGAVCVLRASDLWPEWSTSDLMSGLVVDVGDLTRLVMAATGSRVIDGVDDKLAHELSDCLWAVLVLARRLGVDLGAAFERNDGRHRSADRERRIRSRS